MRYISSPDLAGVDNIVTTPTTGVFTLDFWLKQVADPQAIPQADDRWFCFGADGAAEASGDEPKGVTVGWETTTSSVSVYSTGTNPSGTSLATGTFVPAAATWYHYAIQRSSTYWSLFFDGVLRGRYTLSAGNNNYIDDMQGGDGTFFLGTRSGSSNEYIDGWYDEVRYSNIARYDDTVAINANAFAVETSAYDVDAFAATGTAISTTNVPSSAQTKVSGVMLYKDAYGTATIGTDLKIYFTCIAGDSNWVETTYTAVTPVFSTGVKMVKLGETTCTSGSDVRYKAVWANQVENTLETQLHGIGLDY